MYSDICRVFDGGDKYHAPPDRAGRPAIFYLCTPPGRRLVTAKGSERAGRAGCIVFFAIWYKVHIIAHIIDKWKPHFVHQKLLGYYSLMATFSTLVTTYTEHYSLGKWKPHFVHY